MESKIEFIVGKHYIGCRYQDEATVEILSVNESAVTFRHESEVHTATINHYYDGHFSFKFNDYMYTSEAFSIVPEKNPQKMTVEKLHELRDKMKAMVVDSCMDGTVHLWEVLNGQGIEEYVVLTDNTVITREEDNQFASHIAFFPYKPQKGPKQVPFNAAINQVKETLKNDR